jgi:transposase
MDDAEKRLTWQVTSTRPLVDCPVCRLPTRRIHSRDVRRVAALPWGPGCVVRHLRVRTFFCANGRCPRHIFTERLWPLVAPWARRTQRLTHWLEPIAVALGGMAGGRLSPALGLAVRRHTLRRLLRRLPLPACATPQGLGVAAWAAGKRQRYGPVRLDLARRRPLARWPAREAKTFARWLQAHPGVGVSTRDRSRAYADGARQGAPAALQGADRVHLRQHLAEALDQVLNAHGNPLEAGTAALHQAPVARPDGTLAVPVPPPPLPRTAQELAHQRQGRRLALHQQRGAVHQQGWPGWAIAQPRGIGQTTVDRDRRMETLPARQRRTDRGRSILTPDPPYLLERWNAGRRDALRRCRELQARGDTGSAPTVARDAQRLCQAQGQTSRPRRPRQALPAVAEPSARPLTARRATWLVLRRAERQDEDEAAHLAHLRAQPPEVAAAIA